MDWRRRGDMPLSKQFMSNEDWLVLLFICFDIFCTAVTFGCD